MQVPVLVETQNGHISATVLGAEGLRSTAATREEALQALRRIVRERFMRGEIVTLDVSEPDIMDLFGAFKADPTLQEICDEAYRRRDEEKAALESE